MEMEMSWQKSGTEDQGFNSLARVFRVCSEQEEFQRHMQSSGVLCHFDFFVFALDPPWANSV